MVQQFCSYVYALEKLVHAYCKQDKHLRMFMTTWSVITSNKKTPSPSLAKWKYAILWHSHSMRWMHYSNSHTQPHIVTWMKSQNVILSKRTEQEQKREREGTETVWFYSDIKYSNLGCIPGVKQKQQNVKNKYLIARR